ncbi:MAG: helix-turn-helix transcriptional regulator [Marinifilaceae bacterium]
MRTSRFILYIAMVFILFTGCDAIRSNIYKDMSMAQCDSLLNLYSELDHKEQQHLARHLSNLIDENAFLLLDIADYKYPQTIDYIDDMILLSSKRHHQKLNLLKYRVLINGLFLAENIHNNHHKYLRKKVYDKLYDDENLSHRERIMLYLEASKISEIIDTTNSIDIREQRLSKLNLLSNALILAQNNDDSLAIGRLKIRAAALYSSMNMTQQTQDLLNDINKYYLHLLSFDQTNLYYLLQYNIHAISADWDKALATYPAPQKFTTLYASLLIRCDKPDSLFDFITHSKSMHMVQDSLISCFEQFGRNNYLLWYYTRKKDTVATDSLFTTMRSQFELLVHNRYTLSGHPQYLIHETNQLIDQKKYDKVLDFTNTYVKNSHCRYIFKSLTPYPVIDTVRLRKQAETPSFGWIDQTDMLLTLLQGYLKAYYLLGDSYGYHEISNIISFIFRTRITSDTRLQSNTYASFMHRNNIQEKMDIYKAEKEMRIQKALQVWGVGMVIASLLCIYYYYYRTDKRNIYLLYRRQKERIEALQKYKHKATALENTQSDIYKEIERITLEQELYLHQEFSIPQLTEILNCNRTYISNAINKNTGMNFNQWLNKLRMEHIMRDYPKVKMNIERHIANYGFASRSTFYRAFKQHTGKTPKQYLDDYMEQRSAAKTE